NADLALIEPRLADPGPGRSEGGDDLNAPNPRTSDGRIAHERLRSIDIHFGVDAVVRKVVDGAVLDEQRFETRRLDAVQARAGDRQSANDHDVRGASRHRNCVV